MGMGRLFAERAIAEGAAALVLYGDVDEAALNVTLGELADGPTEVSGWVVDVSDPAAVADTAAAVLDDLGRIDVLIDNAGASVATGTSGRPTSTATPGSRSGSTPSGRCTSPTSCSTMIADPGECRVLNLASAAGFTRTRVWRCTRRRSGRSSGGRIPSASSSSRRVSTT